MERLHPEYKRKVKKVNTMLFEKEIREAEEKLWNKRNYIVCNMVYDNTLYEISDNEGNVLIDHLSVAQVIQLAEML